MIEICHIPADATSLTAGVCEMLERGFGPEVAELAGAALIRENLDSIVISIVSRLKTPGQFVFKDVHKILARFGVSVSRMPKFHPFRRFMQAACVHILCQIKAHERDLFNNIDSFVAHYGCDTFCGMRSEEISTLLRFCNFMKICVKYIPAKNNGAFLLDLSTRLTERHDVHYITGTGQTLATAVRLLIYRTEGSVCRIARAPRSTDGGLSPPHKSPPPPGTEMSAGRKRYRAREHGKRETESTKRPAVHYCGDSESRLFADNDLFEQSPSFDIDTVVAVQPSIPAVALEYVGRDPTAFANMLWAVAEGMKDGDGQPVLNSHCGVTKME